MKEKIYTGHITTTITKEMWDIGIKNYISWKDALARGIRTANNGDEIKKCMQEMQESNTKILEKLKQLKIENWEIKAKLEEIEEK